MNVAYSLLNACAQATVVLAALVDPAANLHRTGLTQTRSKRGWTGHAAGSDCGFIRR